MRKGLFKIVEKLFLPDIILRLYVEMAENKPLPNGYLSPLSRKRNEVFGGREPNL